MQCGHSCKNKPAIRARTHRFQSQIILSSIEKRHLSEMEVLLGWSKKCPRRLLAHWQIASKSPPHTGLDLKIHNTSRFRVTRESFYMVGFKVIILNHGPTTSTLYNQRQDIYNGSLNTEVQMLRIIWIALLSIMPEYPCFILSAHIKRCQMHTIFYSNITN